MGWGGGRGRRRALLGLALLALACSEEPAATPLTQPIDPGPSYRFVEEVDAVDPLREVKARAANEYRNVLRSPHRSRRIRVPANAVLEFGIALEEAEEPAPKHPVRFTLRAEWDAESTELFSATVAAGGGWSEHRVDLSELAGSTVEFSFDATIDAGSRVARAAVWGNPDLVVPGQQVARAPNLLLISLDTLAAGHMGAYGYARDTSPNLDRLARESLLFETCIAPSSWTTPSHASIFTGLPLAVHGAGGPLGHRLRSGFTTLAELARRAGYATAAFTEGVAVSGELGFYQGFDHYSNGKGVRPTPPGTVAETFALAESWLETHGRRPFLLFVHTYEIHWPYRAPLPFLGSFSPVEGEEASKPPDAETADLEEKTRRIARYDEGIAYTDHVMGGFLDFLRESGRLDDTIVVVFSDHGEEFWEHGGHSHGLTLYDEVLRVPLIVRLPGPDPPRGRVARQVALVDVFATATELLQLEIPTVVDSQSLVPLWDGDAKGSSYDRTLVISELVQRSVRWLMMSARTEKRKYIATTDFDHPESPLYGHEPSAGDPVAAWELALVDFLRAGGRDLSTATNDADRHAMFMASREELFDLARDPAEKSDLVFEEIEVLAEYQAALQAALLDIARSTEKGNVVRETIEPLTDAEKRDLQALGYLE